MFTRPDQDVLCDRPTHAHCFDILKPGYATTVTSRFCHEYSAARCQRATVNHRYGLQWMVKKAPKTLWKHLNTWPWYLAPIWLWTFDGNFRVVSRTQCGPDLQPSIAKGIPSINVENWNIEWACMGHRPWDLLALDSTSHYASRHDAETKSSWRKPPLRCIIKDGFF